ncbi:MAG TPA: hypothetical protein VM053_10340 [Gemmatimonadaceae bacterium]|nr:hypothetical protein [Gemmatimonadaceae bacterium]
MEAAEHAPADDHLTFTRWAAGIVERQRSVLWFTLGGLAAALIATVVVPPVYRSNASFVANTSGTSKVPAGASSSPIGGLLSQFGGSLGGDPSESPNFYLQLLDSRELLTRTLESKFPDPRTPNLRDSAKLVDIMRIRSKEPVRRMELGVKQLGKSIDGGLDAKTNLVWFSTDAEFPELSSQIANRLMELVSNFNRETRVSRAKSKREFLERRLDSAKTELRQAEENLRFFYEQNRGILAAPALRAEEQRLKRAVDVSSDLFLNLQGQLEVARIDEINDAALITVIDTAVAPRKSQWPRYGVAIMTGLTVGFLLGLLVAGSATVMSDWRRRHPDDWAQFENSITRNGTRFKWLTRRTTQSASHRQTSDESTTIRPAKPAA